MKAIILAAGYGTRLRKTSIGTEYEEYIKNTPKPLLDVGGKPLINYLIQKLEEVDVDEVRIISNAYYHKQFNEWYNEYNGLYDLNIKMVYNKSNEYGKNEGAVKDLFFAFGFDKKIAEKYELEEWNDDCIVLAGDRWPDFDLEEILRFMDEKNSTVVLALDLGFPEKLIKRSEMRYGSEKEVSFFKEKPENPAGTKICLPFYFFKKRDFVLIKDFLEKEEFPDAPGYFIEYLFNKKRTLYAFEIHSNPFDFGTLDSYLEAKEKLG